MLKTLFNIPAYGAFGFHGSQVAGQYIIPYLGNDLFSQTLTTNPFYPALVGFAAITVASVATVAIFNSLNKKSPDKQERDYTAEFKAAGKSPTAVRDFMAPLLLFMGGLGTAALASKMPEVTVYGVINNFSGVAGPLFSLAWVIDQARIGGHAWKNKPVKATVPKNDLKPGV